MNMRTEESLPVPFPSRFVAWWHVAAFLAATFAFYFAPVSFFGDAAHLQLGNLAVASLAAVLFALSILLVMALRSRSRSKLRMALMTVLVLDVQVPILLFTHLASLEILETRVGFPAVLSFVLSILLLSVPAGMAVLRLSDNAPEKTGELGLARLKAKAP